MSLAALTILATGCARENISAVVVKTPKLVTYSPAFQKKADAEIGDLKTPPCDRIDPAPPCSALLRGFMDNGDLREQVRAAKRKD